MNACAALGLLALGFLLGMAACLLFADGIARTLKADDRSGEGERSSSERTHNIHKVSQ